ncbi:MAG TPA: O-antigen ligase family protein [Solirubrobacterales bacterium]|nr:O-antigen ligase family protein [Solirubrobacterales bacterium]
MLASVVLGVLVGAGQPLAAVGLLVAAGGLFLLTRPRWALWGFLGFLPFFVYPVSFGHLSLFVGLPAALAVSVVLVAGTEGRSHGSIRLPTATFSVLAIAAIASALFSSDPPHALSRVLYLVSFGILAASVAYARSAGVIRDRDVLAPLLLGATGAGIALLAQFVLQFAVGTTTVQSQLLSLYPVFGGSGGETAVGQNWVVPSFHLLRAIFPFMTAPGAGQYMMVAFVTAVLALHFDIGDLDRRWLRWSVLIIGCGLAATLSRQAWVGALVAMAIVFVRARPASLLMGIAVVSLVAFIVPLPGTHETLGQYLLLSTDVQSESSGSRVAIWSEAINYVEHGSILGLGSGQYQTLSTGPAVYYAHNVVLDALVELGYLGGSVFIAFVLSLLAIMWQRSRQLVFLVLVSVVVANMFDDALYLPRNGFLIAALVGMAAGAAAKAPEPASQARSAEVEGRVETSLSAPVSA